MAWRERNRKTERRRSRPALEAAEPARFPASATRRFQPTAWIVSICIVMSASGGFAQAPDAGALQRGIALAVDADFASALDVFKGELLKQPGDPLLNYYVGITEFRLQRLDAAAVHLEKAVAEEAPFPQAFYWLARAYLEQERGQAARAILTKGLDRFPANRDLAALADELDAAVQTPR